MARHLADWKPAFKPTRSTEAKHRAYLITYQTYLANKQARIKSGILLDSDDIWGMAK
jgi:hypothetical protein